MNDLELINRVRDNNDSEAIKTLIDAHTGIYIQTAKYFFKSGVILDEIKEDKYFNLYKFVTAYDPNRDMKLGTYIGERTKYMCINLMNREPRSLEFNELSAVSNDTSITEKVVKHDDLNEMTERAKRVDDPQFYKIFCLRFREDRPRSWREVGRSIGMTQEGARKLFKRHIGKLQEYAKT